MHEQTLNKKSFKRLAYFLNKMQVIDVIPNKKTKDIIKESL